MREYAVEGVREYGYAVGQVYGVWGMLVARQSVQECAAQILGVRAQACIHPLFSHPLSSTASPSCIIF